MSWITRQVRSHGWDGMPWAAAAAIAMGMGITSPVHALPNSSNLAPAGTATANSADFGASITDGIDGNRDGNFGNGSVFYGNAGPPALFYEVDLGVDAYIDRVQILRRTRRRPGRVRQHAADDLQGRRGGQSWRRRLHARLCDDFVRRRAPGARPTQAAVRPAAPWVDTCDWSASTTTIG